jgi:hypothetical protein
MFPVPQRAGWDPALLSADREVGNAALYAVEVGIGIDAMSSIGESL